MAINKKIDALDYLKKMEEAIVPTTPILDDAKAKGYHTLMIIGVLDDGTIETSFLAPDGLTSLIGLCEQAKFHLVNSCYDEDDED